MLQNLCYLSRNGFQFLDFLAMFRQFTGLWGLYTTLASDCGTNLISSDVELPMPLLSFLQEESSIFAHELTVSVSRWEFIAQSARRFGDLWEAAVKPVRHHLPGQMTL
jgi:hypothetical protein